MDLKFLLVDLNSYSPDLFGVIERSFHDVQVPFNWSALPARATLRKMIALGQPLVPTLIALVHWYIVP